MPVPGDVGSEQPAVCIMLSSRFRALSVAMALAVALIACTPEPESDRRLGIDFGSEQPVVIVALCEGEGLRQLTLWGNDGDRIVGEVEDDPVLFNRVEPVVLPDGSIELDGFPVLDWRDDRFLDVETTLTSLRVFFSEISGGPESEAPIASAGGWFTRSEFEKRASDSCG